MPSAGARPGFGGQAAGPARLSPAVRETVEAIVRAVGAGDDILIDRLLTRFTHLADLNALIHLRSRLHTALPATTGLRPKTTLPLTPGSRSPLRAAGHAGVLGQADSLVEG
ncbi:hypothetical protein NJL88_12995 [Streptomyces sp. DK15]|uniref:hypothetical protein n=1 Tax=Streptomyces sp. DK15 TaxID=2957499 RepID=UPI0029BCEFE3|nr:hypothetical protein [Streptomyces sp. DK15]MDX2390960.1 hypothetical protein [Streptomyces sp. DK15]